MKSYFVDIINLKRHTTNIPFYSVYVKKEEFNPVDYFSGRPRILLGNGFAEGDSVNRTPLDFTYRNKFTIEDMHRFLKSLIFPETQKAKPELTDEDYAFLYKYMSMYPADSQDPKYSADSYPNNHSKYIFGDKLNPSVKVFNNSGQDFGFMIDNAYIIDTENGVDFLLTAVVKCNKSNIFGEKYYEYETTGQQFMKNIGNLILRYEIENKKDGETPDFNLILNKIK
jgi:hypothetical protein